MADSASKMRFQAWPGVVIRVRHADNSGLRIYADPTNLVRKFLDFCKEKGWFLKSGGMGPSDLDCSVFILIDKEGHLAEDLSDALAEINAWFIENGAADVCLSCGASDDEEHDDKKHNR